MRVSSGFYEVISVCAYSQSRQNNQYAVCFVVRPYNGCAL